MSETKPGLWTAEGGKIKVDYAIIYSRLRAVHLDMTTDPPTVVAQIEITEEQATQMEREFDGD